VLTRLVAEPERLAEVAKSALEIMHFDLSSGLPAVPTIFVDAPGTACVAACYRCLMSYFNQPDHELLDRRNEEARGLLLRLARGTITGLEAPAPRRPSESPAPADGDLASKWLAYARAREIPAPDKEPLAVGEHTIALVWRDHYVAALFDVNSDLSAQLADKGFEIVVLGQDEAAWAESTAALAKLLGRSV
jgi:hypothetical protein